jgi:membrane-associated phospholipid phosphatase
MKRDLIWLVPVAAVTGVNMLLSAWVAPLDQVPRLGAFAVLALVVICTLALLRVGWILYREREAKPLKRIAALASANAGRAVVILAAIYLSVVSGACFSALKAAIPAHRPFWLDPHLLALEGELWRVSHALLGWATPAIDLIYATWLPVQVIAFYWLLLLRPSLRKAQALISHALAWLLLGVIGAYGGSSAGPIYYDRLFGGAAFADLNRVVEAQAPVAFRTSEMLWRAHAYGTDEVYAGISAMPSMHVALACWLWLLLRDRPYWGKLAALYFALICVGSVHLGWHWALDGVASVAAVWLIWKLVGAVLTRPRVAPVELART